MRTDLTAALYRALFEEWAEHGYAAISLERVASRAGAGKAAIYRRWSAKRDFAEEAIQAIGIKLADFTDHGSLKADLKAYLLVTRRVFRHRLIRRILPDMQAERVRSGDLSDMLNRLSESRRRLGKILLERAIARGELSEGMDMEVALDLFPSVLYMQMIVMGKRVPRTDLERQIEILVVALKAC